MGVVAEPPATDLETFLRFTVDDLFCADHDLERAMDLLAISGWTSGPTVPDRAETAGSRATLWARFGLRASAV